MSHQLSSADREFMRQVESCCLPLEQFDHRAHVRLAYTCLAGHDTEASCRKIRDMLQRFLAHHDVDPTKYHETLTRAWTLAVRHFMALTPDTGSAHEFIARNPDLLDSRIMMTHYSAKRLFSDLARRAFVEPDLEPIPRHDGQGIQPGHCPE